MKNLCFLLLAIYATAGCEHEIVEANFKPLPFQCDSTVSFKMDAQPVFIAHCANAGCHDGTVLPDMRTYKSINEDIEDIQLSITDKTMPVNDSLTTGEIQTIGCWIGFGHKDN